MTSAPPGVEAMVMNPPFTKAAAFIRHALALGIPKVAVLLRLAWLGSTEARRDLLEGGGLARIYVFRKRLPRMHRFAWPGKRSRRMRSTPGLCWTSSIAARRRCVGSKGSGPGSGRRVTVSDGRVGGAVRHLRKREFCRIEAHTNEVKNV